MKSEAEKRFDELSEQYLDVFGENYPLVITSQKTLSEVCEEIEVCLKTGVPAQQPDYEEGAEY